MHIYYFMLFEWCAVSARTGKLCIHLHLGLHKVESKYEQYQRRNKATAGSRGKVF